MPSFRLGSFDALVPLGRGGMAEVWRGVHRSTGADVAIKLVTASALHSESFGRAFEAEVRAVASLDHPGIIRLYDAGSVDEAQAAASEGAVEAGTPFLVMELADGGSLQTAPPPRRWQPIRDILLAILDALAHAHARGVIHRDVKPANILWGSTTAGRTTGGATTGGATTGSATTGEGDTPRVVVSDFGIAHAGEGGGQGPTWGTPAYMAPERFTLEWRDLGPWTDLYSLGCLAFTLLRGQPPYPGAPPARAMQAHLYRPVPLLHARCPVPEGLDAWLRSLLAKSPADRFQTAADAAWVLRALGRAPPTAPAPDRQARDRPPRAAAAIDPPGAPAAGTRPPATAAEITWTEKSFAPTATSVSTQGIRPALPDRPPRPGAPPLPTTWARDAPPHPARALPGCGLRLFGMRVVRMVDRLDERDRLWRALRDVHEQGRPVGVLLRGPEGSGKTRLALWLGERAAETGGAVVLHANHGPGDGVPALSRAIAEHLRCEGLKHRALQRRVDDWLHRHGGTDAWVARDLAAVVAQGAGLHTPTLPTAADLRGTCRRFLSLLAAERPVLLHLDDVPFSNTSLALAAELLQLRPRLPVLLVLTASEQALSDRRSAADTLATLAGRGQLEQVVVAELPPAWRVRFVQELAGFETHLAERIAARTAGNPLFTVALVRDWIARGVLQEDGAGLRLREDVGLHLPDDLHEVWHSRIDGVLATQHRDARPALELAAALGERVSRAEWRAACAEAGLVTPPGLFARLDAAGLAVGSEDSWRWAHGMVRASVLRGSQEAGRLPGAHATCARMLLGRDHAPSPLVRERIGRHLAAAGEPTAAQPFLEAGARGRLSAGDPTVALTLLADLDRCLSGQGDDASLRAGARSKLLRAQALAARGSFDAAGRQARHAALAARALAAGRPDRELKAVRAHALLVQVEVAVESGLPADGRRLLDEARRLLGLDASVPDMGTCQRLAGRLHQALGQLDQAEEAWAEAAEYFGVLHLEIERARCLAGLARVAIDRHDPELATELLDAARGRYRQRHHRQGEADCLLLHAEAARLQGSLDVAEHRFRQAQRLYLRAGSGRVVDCRLGRARLALERGAPGEADRLLRGALRDQPHPVTLRARAAALALDIAAARGDWHAFDLAFSELARLLLQSGLHLVEIEDLVGDAARRATAAEQRARAARIRAAGRRSPRPHGPPATFGP